MKEIVLSWAVFTAVDLSVQEILKILLFQVTSGNAQLAVTVRDHALMLQALIASVGAVAACLPFLRQIRWETGFPGLPRQVLQPWEQAVCYLFLVLAGALAARISVALILEGAGAGEGHFFSAGLSTGGAALWDLQGAEIRTIWDLAAMSILYGGITPVAEELFFRGLVLGKLQRTAGLAPAAANFLSAGLFALYHGAPATALYAFPVGLLLGRAAQRTRSVWPPVILHGIVNVIMLQISFRDGLRQLCMPSCLLQFLVTAALFLYLTERD